tara:strand:+ start:3969 stop:5636 length:1668 start_codon:yes stop_codon:yes gene_type:complete
MVKSRKLNINYKNNKTKKIYKGAGKTTIRSKNKKGKQKTPKKVSKIVKTPRGSIQQKYTQLKIAKKEKNIFNNLNKYALIAQMLTSNIDIKEIRRTMNNEIHTKNKSFREIVAPNPDSECKFAQKYARHKLNGYECLCSEFIPARERDQYNNEYKTKDIWNNNSLIGNMDIDTIYAGIKGIHDIKREIGTEVGSSHERPKIKDRTFIGNLNESIENDNSKTYKWGYVSAGPCWLCGVNVYLYVDGDNKTPCGECEHIGAITASILAGMLKSQNFPWMVLNYGTSHVHCNQAKSDDITMKFVYNIAMGEGEWKYDKDTTQRIVKNIFNTPIHKNEYDPNFKKYKNDYRSLSKDKKNEIINNIENRTNKWCETANEVMNTDNIDAFKYNYNKWLNKDEDKNKKKTISNGSIKQKAIRFAKRIENMIIEATNKTSSTTGGDNDSGFTDPIFKFFTENLVDEINALQQEYSNFLDEDSSTTTSTETRALDTPIGNRRRNTNADYTPTPLLDRRQSNIQQRINGILSPVQERTTSSREGIQADAETAQRTPPRRPTGNDK